MSCIQCNSLLSPPHSGHTQAPYHVSLASVVGDNYEINVLNLKNTFQNLGGNRQGRGPLTHVTGEVITEQTVLPSLSFALLTDILGSVWFPSQIASFCGSRYTLISPLSHYHPYSIWSKEGWTKFLKILALLESRAHLRPAILSSSVSYSGYTA